MTSIDKKLKSIGKKIFVDYYYDFKDMNLDKNALAQKLFDENPKAEKISGQIMRIGFARQIFSDNAQKEALEIIYSSKRLDAETIKKAQKILYDEFRK